MVASGGSCRTRGHVPGHANHSESHRSAGGPQYRGHRGLVASNRDIVRATIDLFGVPRCMFASNFPVDSLCASFATIFGGFRDIVGDLSADEQRALFHDNAVRIYAME